MSPPAPALPFSLSPQHGPAARTAPPGPGPGRNHGNDPWIRAGKIHCPCSAPLRAKTRTRPPQRPGRWRKPPRIPRRRKVGSAGMEAAVRLILRGRRGVSSAPSQSPRRRAGPAGGCQGKS